MQVADPEVHSQNQRTCMGSLLTTMRSYGSVCIINFLKYCDTNFFQKLVDAFDWMHDTMYILRLMEVIDQVGQKSIMQVIIDNGPQYKSTRKILTERRPYIFWISYATHCIDLILMNIRKLCRVQQAMEAT